MKAEETKPKTFNEELFDLIRKIQKEKPYLSATYKAQIRHSGGLLTESMAVAYQRGISDIVKLLTQEVRNEESVQKEV